MTALRKRLDKVKVREINGELVLLDTESDQVHQLNSTASFIWRNCDEHTSREEIAVALANEFDVEEDKALSDVSDILNRLQALGLVVEGSAGRVQEP